MVEEPVTHSGLDSLGDNSELTPRLTDAIEAFVVALYDNKSDADINTLRYHLFCQKQARNDALPPTKDSLIQHSKRANFQAHLWKNALKPLLGDCSPVGNGWVEENGTLNPLFMTAEAAPSALLALTRCGCATNCTRNCKCRKQNLACTEACNCSTKGNCQNICDPQLNNESDSDSDED